jgi:hypothetical protein
MPAIWLIAISLGLTAAAQTAQPAEQAPTISSTQSASPQDQSKAETDRERAAEQLKKQEKQRILGIVPNFNTSYVEDAAPLSRTQKFSLAFHSAVDPFVFVAAAGDAGISQAENEFPGYGQGWGGYAKRFGASYVDDFDGTML